MQVDLVPLHLHESSEVDGPQNAQMLQEPLHGQDASGPRLEKVMPTSLQLELHHSEWHL